MAESDVDDDELQDWRLLSTAKSGLVVPRRGEKDFEPDNTVVQHNELNDSRDAMFAALIHPRKHSSKTSIKAVWLPTANMAMVEVTRGPLFATIGRADSQGRTWLLPEEVIYLVERGSMEVWYETRPLQMSLQACYSECIVSDRDLDRSHVYSYLKRIGYVVARARPLDLLEPSFTTASWVSPAFAYLSGLCSWFRPRTQLVRPHLRSYEAIYSDLQVVPFHNPLAQPDLHSVDENVDGVHENPFQVFFDVWKPRAGFKKSNPGPPDFRVAVVSARDDCMPTLAQTAALFESVPFDSAFESRSINQRLREGTRKVLMAVVDSGVINFFSIADSCFGREQVYMKPRR